MINLAKNESTSSRTVVQINIDHDVDHLKTDQNNIPDNNKINGINTSNSDLPLPTPDYLKYVKAVFADTSKICSQS